MEVVSIELYDATGDNVIVTIKSSIGIHRRTLPCATLNAKDIDSFIEEVQGNVQRVKACRAMFSVGAKVIPFPAEAVPAAPEGTAH